MQHHDIVPDVITHSTVISACEKDQERQQALNLLRTITVMHVRDPTMAMSVMPPVTT